MPKLCKHKQKGKVSSYVQDYKLNMFHKSYTQVKVKYTVVKVGQILSYNKPKVGLLEARTMESMHNISPHPMSLRVGVAMKTLESN